LQPLLLTCPLSVFHATKDKMVSKDLMDGWRHATTHSSASSSSPSPLFIVHTLDCDHMFVMDIAHKTNWFSQCTTAFNNVLNEHHGK